jgi:hypothetical protein
VRSSYHAERQARTVEAGGVGEIREVLEADQPAPGEVAAQEYLRPEGPGRTGH